METFVHVARPARVVFGPGTINRVPEEVARLDAKRVLVIATPEQAMDAGRLADGLGPVAAGRFFGAAMHTPLSVTEAALEQLGAVRADCLVSFGGGSATGLAKALARRTALPILAVPTTYAGSEATPILGETTPDGKQTERHDSVLPRTVVYDVLLTLALPPRMSAVSGLNAMAHAAEALYAPDASPVTSLIAAEALAALARALPVVMDAPSDVAARSDALYGAWLAGTCLGVAAMGLHHKICHVLGGRFGLPHAETHAVVLPYALAYNARHAPDAMRRIAAALGQDDAVAGFWQLSRRLGVPLSLRSLGFREERLDEAAALVCHGAYPNPTPVERAGIRELLRAALSGAEPTAAVELVA